MRSILNTLLVFGVLYLLMYNSYKKELKEEAPKPQVTQSSTLETKPEAKLEANQAIEKPETKPDETQNKETEKPQIEKLGFFSNFAANVVAKLAESDKGSDLILKLVKPMTVPLNQPTVKTNNTFYIDQTFDIINVNPNSRENPKTAYCGAEVVIDYFLTQKGIRIDTKENQRIILGRGEAHPIVENLVIGMKEGQKRRGKIPYPYLDKLIIYIKDDEDKKAGISAEVTLVQVLSPELRHVKIFDDAVSIDPTQLCGYPMSCDAHISKMDGTKLWESKIHYQLGDKTFPALFSYSLFNKLPESKRTVISPIKYLDKLVDNLVDTSVNPDDFVVIEFK